MNDADHGPIPGSPRRNSSTSTGPAERTDRRAVTGIRSPARPLLGALTPADRLPGNWLGGFSGGLPGGCGTGLVPGQLSRLASAAGGRSASGNEWCSWATIHRPSSLRRPSVNRKRFSGLSANSF